jgi:hypothetical protein
MRRSGYERVHGDFYCEPRLLVERLLAKEIFTGHVLDPACGSGTIISVCRDHGIDAEGSDVENRGFGMVRNLFDITEPLGNVISNPPFAIAEAAIRHLLPLIRPGGRMAMVLRTAFLEGACRNDFYATMPPCRIWVSTARASMPPGVMSTERDRHGAVIQPPGRGTTICFSWFIFEPGYRGPMIIDRL